MAPSIKQCHFWRLPLEIRLMIYDLVYGYGKTIRPALIQQGLLALEFGSRGRFKAVLAHPAKNVRKSIQEKRAVSRQYLAETVQHLAEVNTFCCSRALVCDYRHMSQNFLGWIRSLVIIWDGYSWVKVPKIPTQHSRLRRLEIQIDAAYIKELWHHRAPSIKVLRNTALARSLDLIRDIEVFSLVDRPTVLVDLPTVLDKDNVSGTCAEQEKRRAARVEQFEGVLWQLVRRPRAEEGLEARARKTGRRHL